MSSSPNADAVPARQTLRAEHARSGAWSIVQSFARDRQFQVLSAIVVLGAVLRFSTLGARSYWPDEAETVYLVRESFHRALDDAASFESNPPLYYVLAWLWAHLFGTGEAALRSLTALAGTATILVAYGVAVKLVSRRAALVAALLASVSPLVVWHAQDARPYAFTILFSGLSLLCFAYALDGPRPWPLAAWSIASGLALATTYFTFFPIAAEAVWLVLACRSRRGRLRDVVLAIGGIAAVGAALLPFALAQRTNASWIETQSLAIRIVEVPAQFLVGHQPPLQRTSAAVVGLLVLMGVWLLLTRASSAEKRGAGVAAVIGSAALAGPLLLALAGLDGVLTRTLTAAWIPLAVVVAAGFAAERAGRAGLVSLGAVCAVSVAIVVSTASAPKFEREDWRTAAEAIGLVSSRAIVLSPRDGRRALLLYRPSSRELVTTKSSTDANRRTDSPYDAAAVREIVLLAFGAEFRKIGEAPRPPRPEFVPPPAPGFVEVERVYARYFSLVRFRAPKTVLIGKSLTGSHLGPEPAAVLIEGVAGA